MTDVQQRAAARQFAADWEDRGDEKQETQAFWLALLQKVFGVEEPEKYISFERRVEVDDTRTGKRTTKFIDGYIPQTRVLVEQKGKDIVLTRGYKQSDGSLLSPYQQARRYGAYPEAHHLSAAGQRLYPGRPGRRLLQAEFPGEHRQRCHQA